MKNKSPLTFFLFILLAAASSCHPVYQTESLHYKTYRVAGSQQKGFSSLAKETENIDLIIGGHSHTFFDNPVEYKNKQGNDVIVNQVGYAGISSGRLDFEFYRFSGKKLNKSHTIPISQKTIE